MLFATASWRSELSVCERIEQEIELNPTWPFKKAGRTTYVLSVRESRYELAIVVMIASTVFLLVLLAAGLMGEVYSLLPLSTLLISAGTAWSNRSFREYTLDANLKQYRMHIGKQEVFKGDFHNIYIRMRKRVTSSGREVAHLVLKGYHIDRHILTSTTDQIEQLRAIGQRVAHKVRINYFDHDNISLHHVVYHHRPAIALGAQAALAKHGRNPRMPRPSFETTGSTGSRTTFGGRRSPFGQRRASTMANAPQRFSLGSTASSRHHAPIPNSDVEDHNLVDGLEQGGARRMSNLRRMSLEPVPARRRSSLLVDEAVDAPLSPPNGASGLGSRRTAAMHDPSILTGRGTVPASIAEDPMPQLLEAPIVAGRRGALSPGPGVAMSRDHDPQARALHALPRRLPGVRSRPAS